MKRLAIASLFCISLLFSTCKKQDYCPEPPQKNRTCDLMQSFGMPSYNDGKDSSQYRKEYDNTGTVTKVVAGLFTLDFLDSVALRLHYNGTTVYFLDDKNGSDTFLVATFDDQNRLQKMATGNVNTNNHDFTTTEFFYESGRLSYFNLVGYGPVSVSYDNYGNVIHIGTGETSGTFFTYDLSVKAKQQWYSDHFINQSENTLYLAQFMGWLPDLMPVNKLTFFEVLEDDPNDDSPPVQLAHGTLSGHVFDNYGKLISYKVGTQTYTNVWNCQVPNHNQQY